MLVTVYGSLKKGKYNHGLVNRAPLIAERKVKGTLYSVGSYPALLEEGDNEYDAETYDVDDEMFSYINRMEIGAGYKSVQQDDGSIVYYAGDMLAKYCKENCKVIDSY